LAEVPNLRVHAPQNSGYRLLTSLKPSSLARPNCKSGAACDPLQLANKLERQNQSSNRRKIAKSGHPALRYKAPDIINFDSNNIAVDLGNINAI
jgi:hypothetical protein